jgi:ketosteroid isomerase-like protein
MERTLAELLAKDEIRDVLARLARGTDRRDAALIRSCYHPDAVDDHGAFRGSPAEFAEWVPKTLSLFACTMHVLGNVSIELAGDVAHVETYCTAHHVFPPDAPGGARDAILGLRYLDRFERRGGGAWLIASRLCAYEYSLMIPAGEAWPLEAPFVRGRPDRSDPSYRR